MRYVLICAALFFPTASNAQDDYDEVDKAFFNTLMTEPGRIEAEFGQLASKNPALAAYFLGLATQRRCGTPAPSKALFEAGGGERALETRDGKWTFMAGMAAGTMSFPSKEQEASFCRSAQDLVAAAESTVANGAQTKP